MNRIVLLVLAWICGLTQVGAADSVDPSRRHIHIGPDGRLITIPDARGNRLPDFSYAGYGGGQDLPTVPVRKVVEPGVGDATQRIQAALEEVGRMSADAHGIRGAVLLRAGRYEISRHLHLGVSGVVLRGEGQGTILVATGLGRRTLIQIRGVPESAIHTLPYPVGDTYVPVGAMVLNLDTAKDLRPGDTVRIRHPSTKTWIGALGMDRFPSRDRGSYLDWRPETMDIIWDRVVTEVEGTRISLDAPLTMALNKELGQAELRQYSWPERLCQVGIEHLRCESATQSDNPRDEEHAWTGVGIENAVDIWVRGVTFSGFSGSAVAVWESAKRVTVSDCSSIQPISELGGGRRQTFFSVGQQTLFLRCRAEDGRHDFAVGHLAAGPHAFVHCKAHRAQAMSGPIGSWATGVLYDNVTIDGAELALTHRETDDQGVGWAAANSVLWQCVAPRIVCRMPPTAQNWAMGVWGQFVGDGHWRQLNEFAKPDSLYFAQLADRKSKEPRSPSPESRHQQRGGISESKQVSPHLAREATVIRPLALQRGWLTTGERLLQGGRITPAWWRGSILPARATEVGVGVTRFVPGRVGPGYTDDLDQLTDGMVERGYGALDHHWGLWYDRRRDDHQMLRRMNGDVWPPFYEQPWARSGSGTAWDGLSKYDLTRFNPWYFGRLKEFADLAERKGLVLVQQMYFQHNILEAGAHWADFPWRPANCLQETGFPEPPVYVGNKRIFMAEAFYDVSHPIRRDLHRRYIRQCLDVLGNCPNVIFQTGEEYSGPLTFVEFWLDTVAEWQKEKGKRLLLGLSCPREVQDAILADPVRRPLVSVIDLKYWWYTPEGKVYAPPGGVSLAPRQQLREAKGPKSRTDASVARAVQEYRLRYPEKAITVSLDGVNGWAVLSAGGSLPRLPSGLDGTLAATLPRLAPLAEGMSVGEALVLADPGNDYLAWNPTGSTFQINLSGQKGNFLARWIDPRDGKMVLGKEPVLGGQGVELTPPRRGLSVLWLSRK